MSTLLTDMPDEMIGRVSGNDQALMDVLQGLWIAKSVAYDTGDERYYNYAALELRLLRARYDHLVLEEGVTVESWSTLLGQIRLAKEHAIDEQNFEQQSGLRDEEKRVLVAKQQFD